MKPKDIVRTGTCSNHHYIVFRVEPHWFRAEIYNAKGCPKGTTGFRYTIKESWSDAIGYIAVYLAKARGE